MVNQEELVEAYKTFEDLEVYKAAREFRKLMYAVARQLPEFEKFGLTNQIHRASVSLTNNIAEGHGRYHFPDQIKFQLNARGSLQVLVDDVNIREDESHLPPAEITKLKTESAHVLKLINGYIRYLRDRCPQRSSVLHDGDTSDAEELDALIGPI